MSLTVTVAFRDIPNVPRTKVYLYTKKTRRLLNEDTIGELDGIDIETVDMTIRPRIWYDDTLDDDRIKAYLQEMHVVARSTRWEDKYADYDCPEEIPFN